MLLQERTTHPSNHGDKTIAVVYEWPVDGIYMLSSIQIPVDNEHVQDIVTDVVYELLRRRYAMLRSCKDGKIAIPAECHQTKSPNPPAR